MITFRGYCAGDAEAMYALDMVCFAEPFRFTRSAMRRFAETRRARVVISEDGEELVGFCIIHVESAGPAATGYVVTLDVAPEHRGHGLGVALMQRAERDARDVGCMAMSLHVFQGNDAAIRFYERMGYEFVTSEPGFYGAGFDARLYRKPLGS